MAQITTQTVVVEQEELTPGKITKRTALFNPDGTPFTGGGGGGGTEGFTGEITVDGDLVTIVDGLIKSVEPI